jgi:NAD(P)-dependent dehydrogenase (short-subunit alcohol dehydrogenase family)
MTDRVLNGKVALVTGAVGEIGTTTIQLLAERGARIVPLAPSGHCPSAEALSVVADVSLEQDVAAGAHLFQQRRHRGRHQTDSGLSAQDVSPGARPTSHPT